MTDGSASSRPGAAEIYERVLDDARNELERGPRALALSGLFAGFTLGATPLAYAAATTLVHGPSAPFVAALVYPIGYIGAIVGRAQLFTENTLYPVMLAFGDRRYIVPTLRLWAVVLAGNLAGVLAFALIVTQSPALPSGIAHEISSLGTHAVARPFATTFWSALLAGWVLALVAWLVEAADATVGMTIAVWALTFLVGLAMLDHSVATAVETWASTFNGDADLAATIGWQATTVLGNVVGGVMIVTLLNFGQVRSET